MPTREDRPLPTSSVPPEGLAAAAAERGAVWSRYWAQGAGHSCAGSYKDGYGGAIARFWAERFAALPTPARVLDIATGNGALPRLLLQTRAEPGIVCEALDLATVTPPWLDGLPPDQRARFRVRSGCAAEVLPYADAHFDLVTSQYGLEYSDLEHSLPEVRRVLAPAGWVALVLHHAQGRPVRLARIEIDHIEWLLAPGGFLDLAQTLLPCMARAGSAEGRAALAHDAQANAWRESFNALQDRLDERAAATHGDGADVLFETRQAAAQLFAAAGSQGTEAACAACAELRGALQDSLLRLRELCACALDETRVHSIARDLAAPTAALRIGTLQEGQHLMGWTLHGPVGPR
jgi:SAM-dependent methyltransferase